MPDSATLNLYSLVVLTVAAIGGAALAAVRMTGRPYPPTWMALGHGAIAAVGLVMLIVAATQYSMPINAKYATGVLVLAALGGATLFLGFHMRGKALPIPLVLGHGVIAASGLLWLYVTLYAGVPLPPQP